jgi:hypothetical protein
MSAGRADSAAFHRDPRSNQEPHQPRRFEVGSYVRDIQAGFRYGLAAPVRISLSPVGFLARYRARRKRHDRGIGAPDRQG